MLILLQLIALCFAIYNAKHDAPAVNAFRQCGSNGADQRAFHSSNLWLRGFMCIALALIAAQQGGLWPGIIILLTGPVIMWPAFNITLNLTREGGFSWWYLGSSNIDQWMKKRFGERKAGKILLSIAIALIIALNVLLKFA